MLIIPAIDLKDGQCVRLKQGRMEDSTVFSDDPVKTAGHWLSQGARRLHLVDLAASRPPLMAERWRRTVFISLMVAPLASSARLTSCLSCRLNPGSGKGSSEEPPPEIRHSTTSSALRPCTSASMRWAASSPAASGTGCAASTISMRAQGTR